MKFMFKCEKNTVINTKGHSYTAYLHQQIKLCIMHKSYKLG
jgi:hypothetical protein